MQITIGSHYHYTSMNNWRCVVSNIVDEVVWLRFLDHSQRHHISMERAQAVLTPFSEATVLEAAHVPENLYVGHPLAYWQDLLTQNFGELRAKKSKLGDAPIYTLEHGLDQAQISKLIEDVKQNELNPGYLYRTPPLPWLVYAAEFGYEYDGKRYLDGFGPATPGWNDSHIQAKKEFLLRSFEEFQIRYGGIIPSGTWVDWYRFISWPIANAILPRYHQSQLAKVLFHSRNSFSDRTFETPNALGELILRNSYNFGSRQFQDFAQNTVVIGHIAIAILGHDFGTAQETIEPRALDRIRRDLNSVNQSRTWIESASSRSRPHIVKFRGFVSETSRGKSVNAGKWDPDQPSAEDEKTKLQVEPNFFFKRLESDRWQVNLHVPQLSALALNFDGAAEAISKYRLFVKGADTRFLPARGGLLRKGYDVPILEWPNQDEPLLALDGGPQLVQQVLSYVSRIAPGDVRLFKMSPDKTRAVELHSFNVLAGCNYIVVERPPGNAPPEGGRKITLNCEGAASYSFKVPDPMTDSFDNELRARGIYVREDFELRSCGLSPIFHDGQTMELYRHEPNILQFRTNSSIEHAKFSIRLNPILHETFPVSAGEWNFLHLPDLDAGHHRLDIEITSKTEITPGHLNIVIKETPALIKIADDSLRQFAEVVLEPASPSLEDLWEGRITLEIRGPVGHDVECEISFYDHDSNLILATPISLPSMALPVLGSAWNEAFTAVVEKHHGRYDDCNNIVLDFKINETWHSRIECERTFTPVRWHVKRSAQKFRARLIDDGGFDNTKILRAEFATPAKFEPIESRELVEDFEAISDGLYVAKAGDSFSSILSYPAKLQNMGELKIEPKISIVSRTGDSIADLLEGMAYWYRSGHSGHAIPRNWKIDVLAEFHRVITQSTINSEFNSTLGQLTRQPSLGAFNELAAVYESRIIKNHHFNDSLVSHALGCKLSSPEDLTYDLAEFLKTAKFFQMLKVHDGSAHWLTEFALRIANKPSTVYEWANGRFRAGLDEILSNKQYLLQTAHLFVAAINYQRFADSSDQSPVISPSWTWS